MKPTMRCERFQGILAGVKWAIRSAEAVQNVGGAVRILDQLDDDLIISMVQNGLIISKTRSE